MTTNDTSVFAAHSPQARAIARLFYFDLAIAGVIFAVVATLVLIASIRFRARPDSRRPRQDEGNPKLEVIWTVVPAVILAALFAGTVYTMSVANPPATRDPDVVVLAHQWWWEYRYPATGAITANELHLPAGERVLLELRSADVIHSFWVPDLGAKMDAIPAHPNSLWLGPHYPGRYLGTCAEFCGAQHALMGIRVLVEDVPRFAAWEQAQLAIPTRPTHGEPAEGARCFGERTCGNCHTIAGQFDGRVGPDLTHLGDRETLAAGALENTVDVLTQWLLDPQRYKPGSHMPNSHLTASEAHAIAVYLEGRP